MQRPPNRYRRGRRPPSTSLTGATAAVAFIRPRPTSSVLASGWQASAFGMPRAACRTRQGDPGSASAFRSPGAASRRTTVFSGSATSRARVVSSPSTCPAANCQDRGSSSTRIDRRASAEDERRSVIQADGQRYVLSVVREAGGPERESAQEALCVVRKTVAFGWNPARVRVELSVHVLIMNDRERLRSPRDAMRRVLMGLSRREFLTLEATAHLRLADRFIVFRASVSPNCRRAR